jgi:hypothetical protein
MVASREQKVRAQARARAAQARERRRKAERERERRGFDLAVAVSVALARRDEAVSMLEAEAGRALESMVTDEGYAVADAVEMTGCEGLTVHEASRLRRVARGEDQGEAVEDQGEDQGDPVAAAGG